MNLSSDVESNLRGVLQSSKDSIPVSKLQKEYADLVGKPIPCQQLGYDNLARYLESIPNVVRVSISHDGVVECNAVYNSSSAHLKNLVKGQKREPKKSSSTSKYSCGSKRIPGTPSSSQSAPYRNNNSTRYKRKSDFGQQNLPNLRIDLNDGNNRSVNIRSNSKAFCDTFTSNVKVSNSRSPTPPNVFHERTVRKVRKSDSYPNSMSVECQSSATSPQPYIPKTDYKVLLNEFLNSHGLGPAVFKTHTINRRYVGAVQVNDEKFSPYPEDFNSRLEAEHEAAKCAFENLTNRQKQKTASGSNRFAPVSSISCVIQRLHDILSVDKVGIFKNAIPKIYFEKYDEELPDDWFSRLLDKHDLFKVDKGLDEQRSIIFAIPDENFLRSRRFSDDSSISAEVEIESVRSDSPIIKESSTASSETGSTTSNSSDLQLTSKIILPESDRWDVYVTYVESIGDFKIRLIGEEYSVKLENLAVEMQDFYENLTVLPLKTGDISAGDLVTAKVDNLFQRLLVTKKIGNSFRCFFVDHGDFDDFSLNNLRRLDLQFQVLPYQAIDCSLNILDLIEDYQLNDKFIEVAVGNVFIAEIIQRSDKIRLNLSNSKICINDVLLRQRFESFQIPKLVNKISNVVRSYIGNDGVISVNMCTTDFDIIKSILPVVGGFSESISKSEARGSSLFLLKKNESFLRIQILSVIYDKARVFYVDEGHTEIVNVCDILKFNKDFKYLAEVPSQSVPCILNGVPPVNCAWSSKAIKRLEDIIPKHEILVAVLIDSNGDSIFPKVDLYKRSINNELVSVNQTLAFDTEIFEAQNTQVCAFNNVNQRTTLPDLILPSAGELSDIHITLVASPSNFMFQLFHGINIFDQLVLDMHGFYEIEKKGVAVDYHEIKDNEYYAIRHKDEVWYRVRVRFDSDLNKNSQVLIIFIDYGDQLVVSIESIKHLEDQFRHLPPQVIKGKLGGIVPIHIDWEAEDCVRFRELVNEKQFKASILNKIDCGEVVLEVSLTDCSVEPPILIHDILVKEGRANNK